MHRMLRLFLRFNIGIANAVYRTCGAISTHLSTCQAAYRTRRRNATQQMQRYYMNFILYGQSHALQKHNKKKQTNSMHRMLREFLRFNIGITKAVYRTCGKISTHLSTCQAGYRTRRRNATQQMQKSKTPILYELNTVRSVSRNSTTQQKTNKQHAPHVA